MNLLPKCAGFAGNRRDFIAAGLAGLGATVATQANAIVSRDATVPVTVRPAVAASPEYITDKVRSE